MVVLPGVWASVVGEVECCHVPRVGCGVHVDVEMVGVVAACIVDITASVLWSLRACALLGVDIVMADFFPAALTSMKRMVSSTHMSWSGCLSRSSWISASARPMQSWSATRSSPWFTIPSQSGHFFKKRHTSACPRRRAANARMGFSPVLCHSG